MRGVAYDRFGEDFRKGLTFVVSVQHPEPQFNAQTKEKLNNVEVDGIVARVSAAAMTSVSKR